MPTLAVNEASTAHVRAQPDAPALTRRWAEESETAKWPRLTRAKARGVRVAAGSDAGFFLRHGVDNGRETELFVKGGYTPLEAIGIATAAGADLMGIEAGRLVPGKLADILVVDGDPVDDITILRDPDRLRVFKGGAEAAPLPH